MFDGGSICKLTIENFIFRKIYKFSLIYLVLYGTAVAMYLNKVLPGMVGEVRVALILHY